MIDHGMSLINDTLHIHIPDAPEVNKVIYNGVEFVSGAQWIPCSKRLPEEHDSIFSKFYGTEKWRDAMFRKTSKIVIITVEHLDGTRQTAPCHTIDGEWNQSMKGMGKVLAWMPLPEPYKEEEDGCVHQ